MTDHRPIIDHGATRILSCVCGWRTPPGTTDSDDAFSTHVAISTIAQQKGKESPVSRFNGVKVFSATMVQQRQELGEQVTAWIESAQRERPGFKLVDIVVSQSSDEAFHCIAITVFYNEDVAPIAREKKRRG